MHFKIASWISSHWEILGTYRQLFASNTFFKCFIWFFLGKLLLSLTFMQTRRIKQQNNLRLRHTHTTTGQCSHLCHKAGWKSVSIAESPALEILRAFLYKTQSSLISAGHALSRVGSDHMTSRVPFWPKLFYVSINPMNNLIWALLNQDILLNHFNFTNKATELGNFKPWDSSRLTSDA